MVATSTNQAAVNLRAAFASLPEESIILDAGDIERRYHRNVTALSRSIPMALRPGNNDEVVAIITAANERRIPIYPFSTGKNWGMGSKLPVTDGSVVVDLSRLNRILEVNESAPYAVLEPGVTQGQLATYLAEHHPTLTFNVTGAFGETSILGNTLERGDGSHARIDDLIAVRGILGNGQPFEVGGHWGTAGTDTSHVMRYTAGPDLVGLFSQSNFGLVTAIVFRLLPRAEKRSLFWGRASDAKLGELFERLQKLYAQRIVLPAMTNVGYANRFEQARLTLGDETADLRSNGEVWNFYAIFDGSAKLSQAIGEELQDRLAPCCLETGMYESGGDARSLPTHLKPIVRPLSGFPDYESIRLVYRLTGVEPPDDPAHLDVDQTSFGMKSYVGIIPPQPQHVRRAADLIAAIRRDSNLNIKPSFFGDGRCLITVHFLKTDASQVSMAEEAEAAIWEQMTSARYLPYRASVDQMTRLVESRPEFFSLVSQIKSVLDPNHIIAPGRYCPPNAVPCG
jgi:4-cresol dehydrogenase (hydroxylating)